jgi:hypothetical protein
MLVLDPTQVSSGLRRGPAIEVLQVDSQLLALLVEMAALQAQCAGGLRDVAVVAV